MGSENFLAPYMLPEPGKRFVDVGANVGGWAFYVAKRGFEVYASKRYLAPKAFSQVLKGVAAKGTPIIHPYPVRHWETPTVIGRLGFLPLSTRAA